MTTTISCAVAFACLTLIYVARRYFQKTRLVFPLPPGPPGLPVVGNVIGIDTSAPWLTYSEWARTYGDIIHSRIFGKDLIIINSEKIARDLLDSHSSNNSDRPYFITNELYGLDFNSVFIPYGDTWRLHRRFFHQTYRAKAVQRFIPFQHHRACQLLRQLLGAPECLDKHIFEYTSSIILNSAYGYDPKSHDDDLTKTVARVLEIALSVMRPEVAILVGTFPTLLKLPAWLPGMSFKRQMTLASKFARYYVETTFKYSLQRMRDTGTIGPSMVLDGIQTMDKRGTAPNESWMKELEAAAASASLAGSETSHAVLMTFFLMMVLNPKAQERAQAQIDDVVGKGRLPTMDDRPLLPFVDAIYRETVRYSPVIPLSVPHAAVDDDVYRGYHIPKGALLIANLWSMAHDESRYSNPHAFLPERFLNDDGSLKPDDTEHIAYGFGRRICAGRHLADVSVWAVMAKVLAVFKILKPVDENGVEIPVEPKFAGPLSVHPLPFECRIIPRMPGMDVEKLEELIGASTP